MKTMLTTLAALISSVSLSGVQDVAAQSNTPPATATRPAETPQGQTSVPNASPAPTRDQITGENNQSPTCYKNERRGKTESRYDGQVALNFTTQVPTRPWVVDVPSGPG